MSRVFRVAGWIGGVVLPLAFACISSAQTFPRAVWHPIGPPGGWQGVVVDPTNPGVVFRLSVTGTMLARSGDAGATWTVWPVGANRLSDVQVDAGGSTVLYAGNGFRSLDAGHTWQSAAAAPQAACSPAGGPGTSLRADPRMPGRAFLYTATAAPLCSVLARTDDGGRTWSVLQRFSDVLSWEIAFPLSTPDVVYALDANASNALLRSTDAGRTFSQQSSGGWPLHALTADPFDENTVYAVRQIIQGQHPPFLGWEDQQVIRSADGGATWQSIWAGGNLLWRIPVVLQADPHRRDRLIVVWSSRWTSTTDAGANWTQPVALPYDTAALVVDPVIPGRLWAGPSLDASGAATVSGIARSDDDGGTWTPMPDVGSAVAVHSIAANPVDARILLAAVQSQPGGGPATLVRTDDQGLPWTAVSSPFPTSQTIRAAYTRSDPARAYALASGPAGAFDPRVYVSYDGGLTWPLSSPVSPPVAVTPETSTTLYSPWQVSTDSGQTWTTNGTCAWCGAMQPAGIAVAGPAPVQLFNAWQTIPNWPGGADAAIGRLEAGGTWTRIDPVALPWDAVLAPALLDPAVLYVAVRSGGPGGPMQIYVTRDRGDTWARADGGLSPGDTVRDLVVSPADSSTAFLATGSGVYRTSDAGTHWVHYEYGLPVAGNVLTLAAGPRGQLFAGTREFGLYATEVDSDGDGLPDSWETVVGLDPDVAAGDDGAAGDPDRDGVTNFGEYAAGTNPLESERFFAEGVTGMPVGFDTRVAILNPHDDVAVDVTCEFLTRQGVHYSYSLPPLAPGARTTLDVGAIPTLPELANAEFSMILRSRYGVVADRTVVWGGGYGSHAETAVAAPSALWYLAEGATHSHFDLFYLVENPTLTATRIQVTYLRAAPLPPLAKSYTVAALSRLTLWVNQERFPDDATGQPLLAADDVSAVVESLDRVPIVVERVMYQSQPGQPAFGAGHAAAGVAAPATRWFLAEGATNRDYFDEFLLVANPTATDAVVRVTYLLERAARVVKDYRVIADSRTTIWVNREDPALADAAVSAIVESTNDVPILVERAMWWPGPSPSRWTEAHVSAGIEAAGTLWGLAEGEVGGPRAWETYVLIANVSNVDGRARVTLHYEDGTTEATEVLVPAHSRRTIDVRNTQAFPRATRARFGTIVEALALQNGAAVPAFVVERSMYAADDAGAFRSLFLPGRPYWPAGTSSAATRLR